MKEVRYVRLNTRRGYRSILSAYGPGMERKENESDELNGSI